MNLLKLFALVDRDRVNIVCDDDDDVVDDAFDLDDDERDERDGDGDDKRLTKVEIILKSNLTLLYFSFFSFLIRKLG